MMHEIERTLEGPKAMLHLTEEDLPELKQWKVGKRYVLQLTVTQKTKMEEEGMPMSSSFVIEEMKSLGEAHMPDESGKYPYLPLHNALGGQEK